jgi:hypothetical protein
MKKDKKKLALSKERLRLLNDAALSNVQGGTFIHLQGRGACTCVASGCAQSATCICI